LERREEFSDESLDRNRIEGVPASPVVVAERRSKKLGARSVSSGRGNASIPFAFRTMKWIFKRS
jgi:hypothetical protein